MLGITENLMMTVGGLSIYVQAQVVENAPYEVLLCRPFLTLLSANTQDHPDSGQDIMLTCPEIRHLSKHEPEYAIMLAVPTLPRRVFNS